MDASSKQGNLSLGAERKTAGQVTVAKEVRLSSRFVGKAYARPAPVSPDRESTAPNLVASSKEGLGNIKGEGPATEGDAVVKKMPFSKPEFAEAFLGLRQQDQQLLIAYCKTRSPTECVRETGRNCSAHTMGKTLLRLARKIGCEEGVRGLFTGSEPRDSATSAELLERIESQEFRCALSGIEITPETASLDHVVAVSEGGSHCVDNLQWVHTSVNTMKGSMSQTKFIEICGKVATWSS